MLVHDCSIGIELVDLTDDPYPDRQLLELARATVTLVTAYQLPLNRVVGHQHIAIPPGRKADPGKDFPWYEFLSRVGRLL